MAGFLRTLHLISRWDWQQEPLMVDLGGDLDHDAIEVIRTRFSAWRNVDPAMNAVSLFVASDIDPDGGTWTQHEMPPKVVAARMSTLANAAVKFLREKGLSLNIQDLFYTSLAPYDFIINLRPEIIRDHSALLTKYKNIQHEDSAPHGDRKLRAVESFVRDLQSCYSPNLHLFYGGDQGDVIAGLWNPHTLKPKSWNLKMAYSTSPTGLGDIENRDHEVVLNRRSILNEISRLGDSMVESVEVINGEKDLG
ncbi:hypothetical protein EYZ11_011288 [Aspergillus tanneri]|nr:hypothetical protein EYZ11_011288 [Aspergillus tanneri]